MRKHLAGITPENGLQLTCNVLLPGAQVLAPDGDLGPRQAFIRRYAAHKRTITPTAHLQLSWRVLLFSSPLPTEKVGSKYTNVTGVCGIFLAQNWRENMATKQKKQSQKTADPSNGCQKLFAFFQPDATRKR